MWRRAAEQVAHGRFQRSLAGFTAFAAGMTSAEIAIEHYRASYGHKMMWSPVLVAPPLMAAAVAAVFDERAARTWLPLAAGAYVLDGLLGEYYHAVGVQHRPGGWRIPTYNVPMGPPILAPGLMAVVGGLGLLAAMLRREENLRASRPRTSHSRWQALHAAGAKLPWR